MLQIRVLLNGPTLVDDFGRQYVVTGFDEDGSALLSRTDQPAQHPVRIKSLQGYRPLG